MPERQRLTWEEVLAGKQPWPQPELEQRFKDAVFLAVEISGFDSEFWEQAFLRAQGLLGQIGGEPDPDPDPDWIRAQGIGMLGLALLTYLGGTPPTLLARECDLRRKTFREVRSDVDAKWCPTDEHVESAWRTLDATIRVVAAFDPARARS
jgi:hypothetical protein